MVARHGIPAAVRDGLGSVTNEFPAVEDFANEWMGFEVLKRFMRVKERIAIFEAHHHSERDAMIAQAVNPATTVEIRSQGPAERMRNVAGRDAARRHVP